MRKTSLHYSNISFSRGNQNSRGILVLGLTKTCRGGMRVEGLEKNKVGGDFMGTGPMVEILVGPDLLSKTPGPF